MKVSGAERPDRRLRTPETYVGVDRAQGFAERARHPGVSDYAPRRGRRCRRTSFALGGRWDVDPESGTAVADATLSLRF